MVGGEREGVELNPLSPTKGEDSWGTTKADDPSGENRQKSSFLPRSHGRFGRSFEESLNQDLSAGYLLAGDGSTQKGRFDPLRAPDVFTMSYINRGAM